jgi:hypothetical protein
MSFGHGLKVADATLDQLIGAVSKTMTSRKLPSAGQKCSSTDSVLVQAVRTSIPVGDGEEDSRPGARQIWVIGASTPAQSGSAHRVPNRQGFGADHNVNPLVAVGLRPALTARVNMLVGA